MNKKIMNKRDYELEVYKLANQIKIYDYSINELNNQFDEIKKNIPTDLLIDINYFNNWFGSCTDKKYQTYDSMYYLKSVFKHELKNIYLCLKLQITDYQCWFEKLTLIKMDCKTRIKK